MKTEIKGRILGYDDEGHGPALVFVHGFPFDRTVWQPQVAALRGSHRVITVDLRGFGESPAGGGPGSMHRFAEDVHDLLRELQTPRVVLVGHSMGGYVALAFAHYFPEELRGLVLVGTQAGPDSEAGAAGRRATIEKVRAGGVRVVTEAMAPKMVAPASQARMLDQVQGLMATATPAGVIGALEAMAGRADSRPALATIEAPTLVITGAEDGVILPAESRMIAEAIEGARLETLPNAGHLVAFEQADEFNRVLNSWMERLGL